MNLYDIYKQAIELKEDMNSIKLEIEELQRIVCQGDRFIEDNSKFLFGNDIIGSADICVRNARKVKENNSSYHNDIKGQLRNIDLTESICKISKLSGKYEYFGINIFTEKYINMCKMINSFLREIKQNLLADNYVDTMRTIKDTIISYNQIIFYINEMEKICNILNINNDIGADGFRIRLLSEDNSIEQLINNITNIKNMYDIINSLIGDENKKLDFKRVESGTFSIDFSGAITTLGALIPIITVSYKIYSEQFSSKAKLDREMKKLEIEEKKIEIQDKKLKVRGEYIRLIKEACGDNEINFSDQGIQNKLLQLEINAQQLYADNPCIELNNEEIGISTLKDSKIPIKLLEENNLVNESMLENNDK